MGGGGGGGGRHLVGEHERAALEHQLRRELQGVARVNGEASAMTFTERPAGSVCERMGGITASGSGEAGDKRGGRLPGRG